VTRARAALLLSVAAVCPVFLPGRAAAQVVGPASPPRHGTVVLFVVENVSFEDLMSVPYFRALAARGGAGLMTTKVGDADRSRSGYLTIGAGVRAPDEADEALMARVLGQAGVDVCLSPHEEDALSNLRLLVVGAATCSIGPTSSDAVVLAGTALTGAGGNRISPAQELELAAARLEQIVEATDGRRTMVVVISPVPSSRMDRRGDEVTPIVIGASPTSIGSPHALRSDTTRQTGLVANVDVAPTILEFFGIPIPSEMVGSPIEATHEPAPFALHRLHLEQRRVRFPLQLGEVAYVAALGLVGIAALIALGKRGSLPPAFAAFLRFATLAAVAEPVTLLAGGLLPRLTYAWVVPYVAITMVVLAALSLTARSRGPLGPFEFLAAVTLGFVLLDGAMGGASFRVPLLGGTMFDGVRFYGLPNSFIALPLAGSLYLATRWDAFRGFLLLVGVGLFCGFPHLGANVGASITLFAAAGMWWVVRTRPRVGFKEVAFVGGVIALGLAAVLLASRLAPGTPTHAARFVEQTGGSLGRAWTDLGHRLGIGIDQLLDVPAAFIPVLGLIVVFLLALKPPGPIRRGLGMVDDRWPRMIAVLCASSMVAFVANDTGVAAAAPGFMYALTALVYPAFLLARDQPQELRRVAGEAPAGAERSDQPRGAGVNSRGQWEATARPTDGSTT
jgi:hypothetical protein